MCQRIVHPLLQFGFRQRCSRRIVRIAQINHVYRFLGQRRDKMVFCRTRQISQTIPLSVCLQFSSSPGHDVTVNIHRIHGVCYCYFIACTQNVSKITGITFSSVTHKNFCRTQFHSTRKVIMLQNSLNQEIISLFGTVSMESSGIGQFIYRTVHSLDRSRRKRTSHITNS